MTQLNIIEDTRLALQASIDSQKTMLERNRLGQYATPTRLARDIVSYALSLMPVGEPIRFLDPAFGTGSFYSALLSIVPDSRTYARGYEIDEQIASQAISLWGGRPIDIVRADFTLEEPRDSFNLVICNPPYVRHHHLSRHHKKYLFDKTEQVSGIRMSGLAGLYTYFIGLTYPWMSPDGIAGWLIPSEFMDVNYGAEIKKFLTERVTLLHIHRFSPKDAQFDDALVSSSVVWFKKTVPTVDHDVLFTYGGTLADPTVRKHIHLSELRSEHKWSRFPIADKRNQNKRSTLGDYFSVRRGIATGANKQFILDYETIQRRQLPLEFFQPILPAPRSLSQDQIHATEDGLPILPKQQFLLKCNLSEDEVRASFPTLHQYLLEIKDAVADKYLCRTRKIWFWQEERTATPFLCTYMGRGSSESSPIRFILNHSKAIATNSYLMLYPKAELAEWLTNDPARTETVWHILNSIPSTAIHDEGRIYGGGLSKIEPRELINVELQALRDIVLQ